MDLIEDPRPGENAPEFTVSEISGAVKRVIEGEFGRVRVRGEIGRVSRPRSGHVYLNLKDDRNTLDAVIWKGVAGKLATQPEEGMEVIATGRLTTFGPQSKYQMVVETLAPAGAGALMAMLEKRKAKLAAEGLFGPERKRALPYLPGVIGVVSSPSGAVIRDILHRLRERFPSHVLLWPVAVQGQQCAGQVAAAIRGFNALAPGGPVPRPDVIIVARGGGSIEDLWGFNEEIVVRAAAESAIPLISAVGHETDTTLIDHAADRRAPTPSAAAEIAVPVRSELLAWSEQQGARMIQALGRGLDQRRTRLRDLARGLPRPETVLGQAQQRFDAAADRLPAALRAAAARKRLRLGEVSAGLRLSALSARLREARAALARLDARRGPGLARGVAQRRERLEARAGGLRADRVLRDLAQAQARADTAMARLHAAWDRLDERRCKRLEGADRLRQTLGYRETLKRGYAVVRGDGAVVTRKAAAQGAEALEIEFHDGRLAVGGPGRGDPRPAARKGGGKGPPTGQGSLF